jgi:glycerophosphoryl diester phosphodiesterase
MKPSARRTFVPVVFAIVAITDYSLLAEEQPSTPLVIAHRGASGYLPEHTLPGAAMAHTLGADYIEQDVVLTKDGEPLVIHDLFLDYVTNVHGAFPDRHRDDGHFYVADFTLAEIRTLSVHERINPITGKALYPSRYPPGKGNFALATFPEHLELIQGLNRSTGRDVGVCVEIKEPAWQRAQGLDASRVVLKTLSDHGYTTRQDKAILQCFDFAETKRLRNELKTDLRIMQLLNEKVWKLPSDATPEQIAAEFQTIAGYADAIGPGVDFLFEMASVPYEPKLSIIIGAAHKAKLQVSCYTLRADALPQGFTNFAELVRTLTYAGVDGFFTDHADKLREVLTAGLR